MVNSRQQPSINGFFVLSLFRRIAVPYSLSLLLLPFLLLLLLHNDPAHAALMRSRNKLMHAPRSANASTLCGSMHVIPLGWFEGRNMGPSSIHKQEDLEALGKYIAPVLYGGLGNQLFQLAALHVHAKSLG